MDKGRTQAEREGKGETVSEEDVNVGERVVRKRDVAPLLTCSVRTVERLVSSPIRLAIAMRYASSWRWGRRSGLGLVRAGLELKLLASLAIHRCPCKLWA
jgi:hypothetical protein